MIEHERGTNNAQLRPARANNVVQPSHKNILMNIVAANLFVFGIAYICFHLVFCFNNE